MVTSSLDLITISFCLLLLWLRIVHSAEKKKRGISPRSNPERSKFVQQEM